MGLGGRELLEVTNGCVLTAILSAKPWGALVLAVSVR